MIVKYNKETYQVLGYFSGDIEDIILENKNEAVIELDIQDCGQTDIRAFNQDGTVKPLEQQLEEKIVEILPHQHIKHGMIIDLNPKYEDEKIELIKRGLIELDNNMKIVESEEHSYITEKTLDEKFQDKLISESEYKEKKNEEIINSRKSAYQTELDGMRAELFEEFALSLLRGGENGKQSNSDLLTKLTELLEKRKEIKQRFPKV